MPTHRISAMASSHHMKTAVALLTAFLLIPTAKAAPPTIKRLDGSRITTTQAEDLAGRTLTENHVTGAEIAVLNHGKLVWAHSFGLRNREQNLPMQNDTNTWAASITKGLFATYVMQLVEQNQLSLDTPVAQLLPQPLDSYDIYLTTASDLVHDPRYLTITPRTLLSHTSGLANFAFIEPDKKMHLHFAPGSRFAYSGEGLDLLQFVIEQRLHKPLDQLMQDALFTPLNMQQTGIIYREAFAPNVADRYDADEHFISHTKRFPARAAGSMTTSVTDLSTFLTALLGEDGKPGHILQPKTLQTMLTPVITINTPGMFPTFTDQTSPEGPAVGLSYGLGWGLLTHTRYGPAFFKEGHGDGAENYLICFERTKDCMILLTNSDNGELAFRALLEGILGDTVTPWQWEGYDPTQILTARKKPQ